LKVNIIQKVFGTTSKIEIEKMDAQILEVRRKDLVNLFEELKTIGPEDVLEFINNFTLRSAA